MNYSQANFVDNQLVEGYKNSYDITNPVIIARSRIFLQPKPCMREQIVKMTPVHDIRRKEVLYRPSNEIEKFTNLEDQFKRIQRLY